MGPHGSSPLGALALLACASACGTTELLRPVGAGDTRVSVTAGGPIVVLGGPVGIPITTVDIAHGVSDAVDIRGGLHPTAAAFGVAGVDGGFAWHPVERNRGAFTLGFDSYGFYNGSDAVWLVDPWFGGRSRLTPWFSLGAGMHLAVRAASTAAYERTLSVLAPTLFVQGTFLVGHVALEIEPRWYALGTCGDCSVVPYASPGTGALGIVIGVAYDFQGERR